MRNTRAGAHQRVRTLASTRPFVPGAARWRMVRQVVFVCLIAGLLMLVGYRPARAADTLVSGQAVFKPLTEQQLAALPANSPFSRADLASGRLSFQMVINDAAPDTDPDPHTGRYPDALRRFRVTIGATTLDLPLSESEMLVSDGGNAKPCRESVRVQAKATANGFLLRAGWMQTNEPVGADDLRGARGALTSDAVPASTVLAGFPSPGPLDKMFFLKINAP